MQQYMTVPAINLCAALVVCLLFVPTFFFVHTRNIKSLSLGLATLIGPVFLVYLAGSIAWVVNKPNTVARLIFLCIAILLPSSLFFLFMASKRESLFNQYIASLDRLGLLRKRQIRVNGAQARHYSVEDDYRFTQRVRSYLDRFGAIYGSVPAQSVGALLENLKGDKGRRDDGSDSVGEPYSTFEVKTVLPVFGASALIALGWFMVLPPFPDVEPVSTAIIFSKDYAERWFLWAQQPILAPICFSFLGAYFYSLQMIIRRYIRRDLGSNAYNAVSLRIILSTLAVWVAIQCLEFSNEYVEKHRGEVLALSFAVGVFPLIVWQLVANALKSIPGARIVLPNLEGTAPLSQIDGLSVWHEDRLEEEDIENVPNLASADIVELMLNTKISPNRIIDWVDQAMFLQILQGSDATLPDILRKYGIRTASSLVAAAQIGPAGGTRIIDSFPSDAKPQVIAMAAAVQLNPNYLLVQSWLSVEPHFPPDRQEEEEEEAAPAQDARAMQPAE